MKQVLVIADSEEYKNLITPLIKKDIDVISFSDSKSARDYIDKYAPDVIIIGDKLIDMIGLEFISVIDRSNDNMKIIYITSLSDSRVVDILKRNFSINFVIRIPFDLTSLNSAIESSLAENI